MSGYCWVHKGFKITGWTNGIKANPLVTVLTKIPHSRKSLPKPSLKRNAVKNVMTKNWSCVSKCPNKLLLTGP